MRRMAGCSLAITLCLAAGGAWGQPTVAVLGVEAAEAPADLAVRVTTALRTVVKNAAGYREVAGKDLDEIKLVFGCVDEKPECMARAGGSMQVAKLIWGNLKKAPGGYALTLKLLDVATARVERFATETVSAATMTAAGTRAVVERLGAGLLGRSSGTIKVTCNIVGAEVMVGTKSVGQIEERELLVRDLAAGTVTLSVKKEGYRTWTQEVVVQAGDTALVDVTLEESGGKVEPVPATQPVVTPTPPSSASPIGWKIAFWSSAAATVGLAVGAIVTGAQVLDGRGDLVAVATEYHARTRDPAVVGSDKDICAVPAAQSPQIANTCSHNQHLALVTSVLWGVAAGMAVISGVLYWKGYIARTAALDEPAAKPRQASRKIEWHLAPGVGPTGGSVGLNLRF